MRVCLLKANNRILEMQSHAREGTLISNALLAGFALADIEEREVTPAEYAALVALQPKTHFTRFTGRSRVATALRRIALLRASWLNLG